MINALQIRSARALLDWSTLELAQRAGMTVNALNRIERGHVTAQRGTVEKLEKIFEIAGIEFLPSSGLRKKDNKIITFEGKNFQEDLIDDIANSLGKTGGELFTIHENSQVTTQDTSSEILQNHFSKHKTIPVTRKSLISEHDAQQLSPPSPYHVMPEAYLSSSSLYLYSSKLALSTGAYSPKAVVIDCAQIAESIKKMFDYIWDNTENRKTKPKRTAGRSTKRNAS